MVRTLRISYLDKTEIFVAVFFYIHAFVAFSVVDDNVEAVVGFAVVAAVVLEDDDNTTKNTERIQILCCLK